MSWPCLSRQHLSCVRGMLPIFSSLPAPSMRYDRIVCYRVSLAHSPARDDYMIHFRPLYSRFLPAFLAVVAVGPSLRAAEPSTPFEREIVPILRNHCLKCHSGATAKNE